MADTQPVKEKKKKKTGVKSTDGTKKSSTKKEESSVKEEIKETTQPSENNVEPKANAESQQNTETLKVEEESSKEMEETPTANAVETVPSVKPTQEEKSEEDLKKSEIPEPKIERKKSSFRKGSRRNLDLFSEIDDQKLHQLKEAFTLFDFNRDGIIDRDDLRKSFIALGKENITKEEIDHMMAEAINPLDFDAFVILLGYKTVDLDPEEVIRDALSRWDYDGSGLISEERIRHDLMTWGDKFTPQEVDYALEDAPIYRGQDLYQDDRMIDYIKFCSILCGLRKKTRDPQIEDFM